MSDTSSSPYVTNKPSLNDFFKRPHLWVSAFLGSGLIPIAPGTWGSLFFVIIYTSISPSLTQSLSTFVLFFALGLVCTKLSLSHPKQDPKWVTVDEALGQWIPLLVFTVNPSTAIAVVAFISFRFFDVLKPYPISWMDKNLKGAWGIILDDIVAGILAFGVTYLVSSYL